MEWSLLERRKLMKLMETAQLKTGEKYCLAYHPSRSIQDLQDLGGVGRTTNMRLSAISLFTLILLWQMSDVSSQKK